jgi:hypothetical protein
MEKAGGIFNYHSVNIRRNKDIPETEVYIFSGTILVREVSCLVTILKVTTEVG